MTNKYARPIRSYVLRGGRGSALITARRQEHWAAYGLSWEGAGACWCWEAIFGRKAPVIVEIGFGMGDNLLWQAHQYPEKNFVGIEVHKAGIARIMSQAHALGIHNLKIVEGDAVSIFMQAVPLYSLDKVLILFPDPWPKRKHHKRRLIQPEFITLLTQKMKMGAQLHMATDWVPYAEHMIEVLEAHPSCKNLFGPTQYAPSPYERSLTKFEQRGQKRGYKIGDLVYCIQPV